MSLSTSARFLCFYVQMAGGSIATTREGLGDLLGVHISTIHRALVEARELDFLTVSRGYRCIVVEQTDTPFELSKVAESIAYKESKVSQCNTGVSKGAESVAYSESKVAESVAYSEVKVQRAQLTPEIEEPVPGSTIKDTSKSMYKEPKEHIVTTKHTDTNKHIVSNSAKTPKKRKRTAKKAKPKKEPTPSNCPSIPKGGIDVSNVAEEAFAFPYAGKGYNVMGVWYWVLMRYKRKGIDHRMISTEFGKKATIYARNLGAVFGKDWDEHRKYIDWFFQQDDDFIRNKTHYGFEYMTSNVCLNKYKASTSQTGGADFIDSDEERQTHGRWIQE
ncbi:MAG: hypothetical protein KOO63_08000 [Bacteroidales bacterium]|nr:hypothetical protein [Candidatus Latescibacterota bacterium]